MLKVLSFFLSIFSVLSYAIELPTQKIFPPYPPVWGYDISDFPAIKDGEGGSRAYRMADGDIWFLITHSHRYKDPMQGILRRYTDEKFILLKFFKGEKVELNLKQRNEFLERAAEWKIPQLDSIVSFSDGGTLRVHFFPSARLCLAPMFLISHFIKMDAHHNEKQYSILGVRPHVEILTDNSLCEVQSAPFFYQRLYPLYLLIDLGDDTFIAYSNGSPLMLRFDKNLHTQFKAAHPVTTSHSNIISRNFFVLDYSVIGELQNEYLRKEVPVHQRIHDELLDYLKRKYS